MWDGEDLSGESYEKRFMINQNLIEFFKTSYTYSHLLSPQPATELPEYLADYFARGGEGVVLIDKNAKYAFGSRPVRASVKIKKSMGEFEAKVIGVLEPNKLYEGKEIENWKYWIETYTHDIHAKNPLATEKRVDGSTRIKSINYSYTPVTKPYFYGWKNAIRCEYEGRTFDVASGLSDDDREWLASLEAAELIDRGLLYAVVSAMELTPDSVRHPYLIRLRADI